MKQVMVHRGNPFIAEVGEPICDEYGVVVQVAYSCVSSGTEVATIQNSSKAFSFDSLRTKMGKLFELVETHGISGTASLVKIKRSGTVSALGYSCSGRVVAVGSKVKKLRVGDLVACGGAGFAHHADLVYVPEHLTARIPDDSLVHDASITTVGAIALQGVRRASVQLGDRVCVMGLGLLGQLTVQLVRNAGCVVYGTDVMPDRLTLAQQLGAHAVYNATSPSMEQELLFATEHYGVDVTIITAASASNQLVQQAMRITRKKGKVVIVGDVGLGLEREPLYSKEIDLLISCSYGPGRYDDSYERYGNDYPYAYVRWTEQRNMQAFVDMLARKSIIIEPLIADVPVVSVSEAYQILNDKKRCAVVLSYDHANCNEQSAVVSQKSVARKTYELVRVGMVGVGGFARTTLLPLVVKQSGVRLEAIVDTDTAGALTVARSYGVERVLTNTEELGASEVDAFVVACPHKYQVDHIIRALDRGIPVFAEKPAVTTFEDYERLVECLERNPQASFVVDYNRSHAPFIQKIRKCLEDRTSPLMMTYRMNAGFVSIDHWTQTAIGGGRLIGEACHIIDLFCSVVGTDPVLVSAQPIGQARADLLSTDNCVVHVSFRDGSVCSLIYTALGHKSLGKERCELFWDGKSVVMDDYRALSGYGVAQWSSVSSRFPDKGHAIVVQKFFDAVRQGNTMPQTHEHLLRTMYVTLVADALVRAGGGSQRL